MLELTVDQFDVVSGEGVEDTVAAAVIGWVMLGYEIGKDLAERDNYQCKAWSSSFGSALVFFTTRAMV